MIVTKRWKYGCPFGHIQIRKLRQGKHAGQIFCKTCLNWYPAKVLRSEIKPERERQIWHIVNKKSIII